MSSLLAPPGDLSAFPAYVLQPSDPVFRIHKATHEAWWFCNDGFCRFDLQAPLGTCYAAENPLGAVVETFRDFGAVSEQDIASRRIATLRSAGPVRLADCTAARARGYGLTAEIHSTPQYDRTRQWATSFAAAGFEGIRYFARHDPSAGLRSFGLFGKAGAHPRRSTRSAPISIQLLERVANDFGIEVLPAP